MEKRNSFAYVAIGILVMIITFVVFILVNDEKAVIDQVGLSFVMIAELFFFGGIIFINGKVKKNKVFITAGTISTLSLYLVLAFIISMVFGFGIREEVKILAAVQLTLLALTIVICVLLKIFSGRADDGN